MIYLDNAATTNKKPKTVYKAVSDSLKNISANAGRGAHTLSLRAAKSVYETRETLCEFMGFSAPERVVFTLNATYALNMAIKGLIREKCHVIISDLEHNSVLRPINKLKKELGISYSIFCSSASDIYKEIESCIRPDTKAIVSTLASNVSGKEIPFDILSKIANKRGLKLIVDASQYIGHKKINLKETPCSALCAPAHKGLFGIMGLGFAVFDESEVNTLIEGGSGNLSKSLDMPPLLPERLEGGTLPIPAISALHEGVRYIESVGFSKIESKSKRLTELCAEMILSVPGSVIYGKNLGIVSFNLKGLNSEEVCYELDRYGICVRGGLHCSPLAHESLGTSEFGAVRVSLSHFNNERELYALYKALKRINR